MVTCEAKSIELVYMASDKTRAKYMLSNLGPQGDYCMLRMKVIEGGEPTSGVAVVGGGDPHVEGYVECTYKKSKENRVTNNDLALAKYLPQAMAKAAGEGRCEGTLIQLWENDKIRMESFSSAVNTKDLGKCNAIKEENYKQDCIKTVQAIKQGSSDACESVNDPEMKLVCSLNTLS